MKSTLRHELSKALLLGVSLALSSQLAAEEPVGEKGALSAAGQNQALARRGAPDPPFLRIDTPTSSLTPGGAVTLVSAAKYASLEQAIANERYLFIPAGIYNLSRPLSIRGWRGGVIMGAGRFTTTLNAQSSGGVFKIEDSQDVFIGNLFANASSVSQGVACLETVGTTTSSLFLFSMLAEGPHMGKSATDPGPAAFKFGAPGVTQMQGIHGTGLGIGLSVENTNADVSIMGGNYQSNRMHIRQIAGHLEIRSTGFQGAYGGVDVEIQSPSSKAPHLIEGVRTEGPDSLLRVPATTQNVTYRAKSSIPSGCEAHSAVSRYWSFGHGCKGLLDPQRRWPGSSDREFQGGYHAHARQHAWHNFS